MGGGSGTVPPMDMSRLSGGVPPTAMSHLDPDAAAAAAAAPARSAAAALGGLGAGTPDHRRGSGFPGAAQPMGEG